MAILFKPNVGETRLLVADGTASYWPTRALHATPGPSGRVEEKDHLFSMGEDCSQPEGCLVTNPASLNFLIGYGQRFQPMITIGEYTKLFLTIIIGLGLIFEMPILVFFLALMRVITARWMLRNLRYSIRAIFVVAAIVTPTTDILNMCLFGAPMVALYAIGIGVAWLVNSARERGAGAV